MWVHPTDPEPSSSLSPIATAVVDSVTLPICSPVPGLQPPAHETATVPPWRFRFSDAILVSLCLAALAPLSVCWYLWPGKEGPFDER